MINFIQRDPVAFPISAGTLEENGIKVSFGESLTDANGDVDLDRVAILKPDMYYNTKDFARPPKSTDGVVIVKHGDDIHLYIAELKSSQPRNIDRNEIKEKFDTIFGDFFSKDFKHIFLDFDYSLKNMSLWLICNPTNIKEDTKTSKLLDIKRKINGSFKGMLADYATSLKPYKFRGMARLVTPIVSPPTIECDHFTECLKDSTI